MSLGCTSVCRPARLAAAERLRRPGTYCGRATHHGVDNPDDHAGHADDRAADDRHATAAATPTTAMGRRCGGPDAETTSETVAGPSGERLGVVTVGRGPTVALLLHQTDRVASCGWWRFANRLADQGVRAVLLDFCDYGSSTCGTAWAADYSDQVARTVARLRDRGPPG